MTKTDPKLLAIVHQGFPKYVVDIRNKRGAFTPGIFEKIVDRQAAARDTQEKPATVAELR